MYLSELMPDRTVLLLSGHARNPIAPACEMARELAPAMLVLEDIDLVAENRMYGHETSLLFELLNQMDGLNEDTDIVFVLTTNRPKVNRTGTGVSSGPHRPRGQPRSPTPTAAAGCSTSTVPAFNSTCTIEPSSSLPPNGPRPRSSAKYFAEPLSMPPNAAIPLA
jgi:hypothetical protein